LIGERCAELFGNERRGLRSGRHVVGLEGENLDAAQRAVSRVGVFDLLGAVDESGTIGLVTLGDLAGQHLRAIRLGEPRDQGFGQVVAPNAAVESGGHRQHPRIGCFHRIDGFDHPVHPREHFCFLRLGELRHRLGEDRRGGCDKHDEREDE
jgi:hypothetical protein